VITRNEYLGMLCHTGPDGEVVFQSRKARLILARAVPDLLGQICLLQQRLDASTHELTLAKQARTVAAAETRRLRAEVEALGGVASAYAQLRDVATALHAELQQYGVPTVDEHAAVSLGFTTEIQ